MRKFRGTIIIAMVFIAFLAYYYLTPKDTGVDGFESLVKNIEGKVINEVVLEGENGEKRVIKEDDVWYVIGDDKYEAEPSLIDEMIYKLSGLESLEIITTNPDDLQQFGLESPQYRLFIKAGNSSQEIYIGDFTPSGDCYFVKLPESDTVYKVGKSRFKEIIKPVDELRLKQVFTGNTDEITKIEVTIKGNNVLTLVNEGVWKLVGEDTFEQDEDQVGRFVSDLRKIEVQTYHHDKDTDLSFYGLDNPTITVNIIYQDGLEEYLELGSSAGMGEVYGRRKNSDTIFSIPYEQVQFLENMTVIQKVD